MQMLGPAYPGGSLRSVSNLSPSSQPVQGRCIVRNAFVGQSTTGLAQEYHESDFDWEDHAKESASIVARQQEAARSECSTSAAYEGERWETFYQQHTSARFFKERRYLLLEFPILAEEDPPKHVIELGAGCGSSILPVLKANQASHATVTDISATSLNQLLAAATSSGVPASRIEAFPADSADPALAAKLAPLHGDVALIMFTMSAVMPEQQLHMLRNAYVALKPGGLLLIRDHGLYDMVQLRIPPEECIGPCLYKRAGDGTLSYFFSVQDLSDKAKSIGFTVEECKYVCVFNENKKRRLKLKRVFIHGVFQRPFNS